MMTSPILFFDGVCLLCNGFVSFLLQHDKKKVLRFALLQGATVKQFQELERYRQPPFSSVVLLIDGQVLTNSTAILEAVGLLGGLWKVAYCFFVLPRCLRDALYQYIARHRYSWFGKEAECRRPLPNERERFLP